MNTKIVIKGNLTEIPSGRSYSEYGPGQSTPVVDMHFTTRIPGKMSQRSFFEYVYDNLYDDNIIIKIYRAGQQVWSKQGEIDACRSWAYQKAMKVGATVNRREGKTNKDYTFTIEGVA